MAKFMRCDLCKKEIEPGTGQRLHVGNMKGEGSGRRYIASVELDICDSCEAKHGLPRSMWERVEDKDPIEALKDALFAIFDELHADMEHE